MWLTFLRVVYFFLFNEDGVEHYLFQDAWWFSFEALAGGRSVPLCEQLSRYTFLLGLSQSIVRHTVNLF